MHAFDRRTHGRTDRILIARPRVHPMQRGKNEREQCRQLVAEEDVAYTGFRLVPKSTTLDDRERHNDR